MLTSMYVRFVIVEYRTDEFVATSDEFSYIPTITDKCFTALVLLIHLSTLSFCFHFFLVLLTMLCLLRSSLSMSTHSGDQVHFHVLFVEPGVGALPDADTMHEGDFAALLVLGAEAID